MRSEWLLLVELIARICEGICLYLLFSKFGSSKIKKEIWGLVLTAALWVALGWAVSALVYSENEIAVGRMLLSLCLRFLAATLLGAALYRIKAAVLAFAVMTFVALTYIAAQMGQGLGLLSVYGADALMASVERLNEPQILTFVIFSISVLRYAVAILVPIVSVKWIVNRQKYRLQDRGAKEIVSYMFPTVMGCFSAVVLYFIFYMVNDETRMVQRHNDLLIYVCITAAFAAIWLAILYSFRLQQEMIGLQEEQAQKRVLENQISQMQNAMAQTNSFYENARRIKHDVKNQMAVLKRLIAEQGEANAEITQYFGDIEESLKHLEQEIHTGNAVSDAVIGSKFQYARKELPGVLLDADDFILPQEIFVRAYDIGIILNNGLDNAIEALKQVHLKAPEAELYIKIRSYRRQNLLFVEIENCFDGEVVWGNDGIPETTKPDKHLHGIGLKNIRYCAQKYMGEIDCTVQGNRFLLSVVLKGERGE